jgi:hypothetical protein
MVSSLSASFGGGWDLVLFFDAHCQGSEIHAWSPMSVSLTGLHAWQNDEATSFVITQA